MSQIAYRGNLSAKQFPFLTDYQGRTVVMPGNDNTFSRYLTSSEDTGQQLGIPVAYYMHNCIPMGSGFQSVGYDALIPAVFSSAAFTSAQLLRSNAISPTTNGPKFYFAPTPAGQHYTFVLGGTIWSAISNTISYDSSTTPSYATVQGISYIYFPNLGCYKWDSTANTLVAVTLTGLDTSVIIGITAYQGYLIAWDTSNVYWSSVLDIDPTTNSVDFTPSLISGAGNIRPEGARGPITVITPATFGLAIYTTANIVSAVYSGNARYPFNFKEVVASGGCSSLDLVTYDANTGNQYAYTTSGFQTITATTTQTPFPDLTDFLAGQEFEDFDEINMVFSQQSLTAPLKKKMVTVADRYLVISYGVTSLTHALVYDISQERFGKLKIPHVACFEYQYLEPLLADAPRKSIAFLKADGSAYVVNMSVTNPLSKGVILLGKFQYVRSRFVTLEECVIQNAGFGQSVLAWSWSSVSGGTLAACTKTQLYDYTKNNETERVFKAHITAFNHSIMLVGGFALSSFSLTFHLGARR